MIELLVVIAIILILAALLTPAVFKGLRRARQTQCAAHLHNFGIALLNFRTDTDDNLPDWLSNLYPRFNKDLPTYLCPSDVTRGAEGGKPSKGQVGDYYPETNDNALSSHPTRNTDVTANSYFYEFSGAECGWWSTHLVGPPALDIIDLNQDGTVSWKETKIHQLAFGDRSNGGESYPAVSFPIVRCFHHTTEMDFLVPNDPEFGGGTKREGMTQNLAYAGNVFVAPLTWELTPISN